MQPSVEVTKLHVTLSQAELITILKIDEVLWIFRITRRVALVFSYPQISHLKSSGGTFPAESTDKTGSEMTRSSG